MCRFKTKMSLRIAEASSILRSRMVTEDHLNVYILWSFLNHKELYVDMPTVSDGRMERILKRKAPFSL